MRRKVNFFTQSLAYVKKMYYLCRVNRKKISRVPSHKRRLGQAEKRLCSQVKLLRVLHTAQA